MMKIEKILLENNRNRRSQNKYYVVYISKDDGREGQGYYCKTMEEAEETKCKMEQVIGAQLWDVVIRNN